MKYNLFFECAYKNRELAQKQNTYKSNVRNEVKAIADGDIEKFKFYVNSFTEKIDKSAVRNGIFDFTQITHIELICYLAMMLNNFDGSVFRPKNTSVKTIIMGTEIKNVNLKHITEAYKIVCPNTISGRTYFTIEDTMKFTLSSYGLKGYESYHITTMFD